MPETKLMSDFRVLFGENRLRSIKPEYYEWKIVQNCFKRGQIYLEKQDGIIAGSTTITPKKISCFGEELLAAEIGDTFTHPDYRKRGIFSRGVKSCTRFAISQGIEVIYGTPNSQSLPGYQNKLGYPTCSYVKVNNLIKNLKILMPTIKSIVKLILLRDIQDQYQSLIALWQQWVSQLFIFRSKGHLPKESFDICLIDKFKHEIDGLWGVPRYLFFTIRDNIYLNWRYFDHPDTYQVLIAEEVGEPLGYAVTKLSKDGKIGTICDFITIEDRMDVFAALIRESEKMLKKAGVDFIQLFCVEDSPYFQTLLNLGYYDLGPKKRQPIIVYAGTEYGKRIIETDAKWHFTIADSDLV
ncbi:MAG TPA: GNAT family N-acetyltransferase [Syntrophales bacterium]|nr:GNAT family N-acetyltransferase [Syntrophales bacterium]